MLPPPTKVSPQASALIASLSDPATLPSWPERDDLLGWDALRQASAAQAEPLNVGALERCGCTVAEEDVAGMRVLRVLPRKARDDALVVFAHGGAYVTHTADTTLFCAAQLAEALGRPVLSVDYPLAPEASWREVTNGVAAVVRALAEKVGWCRLVLAGDSAGGGMMAGLALKLRDEDGANVAALLLASPWADLTDDGDSRLTLAAADPVFRWDEHLSLAAAAYADEDDRGHAHVSPVHGDFAKAYPPTLITAGTRELLLSDSVRLASAIRTAGGDVVLDLYDGMIHVFHLFLAVHEAPEALAAYATMRRFLDERLGLQPQALRPLP